MNKQTSIFVLVILALGLPAFYAINRVAAASDTPRDTGNSAGELNARINKLEAQVASLQAQMKDLASKASSRVLALPNTPNFPVNKMPPGATEHEYGGMKYWIVPLKDGK
jgi:hypothetical protein